MQQGGRLDFVAWRLTECPKCGLTSPACAQGWADIQWCYDDDKKSYEDYSVGHMLKRCLRFMCARGLLRGTHGHYNRPNTVAAAPTVPKEYKATLLCSDISELSSCRNSS